MFNYKFQVGASAESGTSFLKYFYLNPDSILTLSFSQLTAKYYPHKGLVSVKEAHQLLKKIGQPNVVLDAFNANSLFLYYNACFDNTRPTDTQRFVNVIKQPILLIEDSEINPNVFHINKYKKAYWLPDTIYISGQLYELNTHNGYCISDNKFYAPLVKYDTIKHQIEYSKVKTIICFDFSDTKISKRKVFLIRSEDSDFDFKLKIDRNGNPLIINQSSQSLNYSENQKSISYEDLSGGRHMYYVYDVDFAADEIINFIGVLKDTDKTIIKGRYNIKTKKTAIDSIGNHAAFSAAQIRNGFIYAYITNSKSKKIQFRKIQF